MILFSRRYTSILLLQDMIKIEIKFNFSTIDTDSLILEINKLKLSKTSPLSNIPINIFKQFVFLYDYTVTSIYNTMIITCQL